MNKSFRIIACTLAVTALWAGTSPEAHAQKRKRKRSNTTAAPVEATPVAEAPVAPPASTVVEVKLDSLGYNALSVRPIHSSDVMYKMTVWRRINFKEKCNEPFFSYNNEISRIIMDAVQRGALQAYESNGDSVNRPIAKEEFMSRVTEKSDNTGEPIIDPFTGKPVVTAAAGPSTFPPKQLDQLELKEDLIFDKQRSRQYYDIQTVAMIIPSSLSPKGIEQPLATFRYKDMARLFASLPNAKWYNFANRAEDKKLADAFDLRLFCSRIVKMSNPKDQPIDGMPEYAGNIKASLIASQQAELDIVEKENELWDF